MKCNMVYYKRGGNKMNTEFYRQMVAIKREKEMSIREFATECGLCHGTLIEFFNKNKPFRPLRDRTMAKINHTLGISYEVMEEYNNAVLKERE